MVNYYQMENLQNMDGTVIWTIMRVNVTAMVIDWDVMNIKDI
jgi:hypothetical protein